MNQSTKTSVARLSFFFLLASTLSFHHASVEARSGVLRRPFVTKSRRTYSIWGDSNNGSGSSIQTTHPTNQCQQYQQESTTKILTLAKHFEEAISAASETDSNDIHVGHLLTACERLGETMESIGFSQSARDIAGNIQKVRRVRSTLPPSQRDSMPAIVEYEMRTGVHSGRSTKDLKGNSATMGLLWLGRSLSYQNDMFHQMIHEHQNPYEAAKTAFEKGLKPHLSWTLQKLAQTGLKSLKSMPTNSILSKVGGIPEECYGPAADQATRRDLGQVLNSWNPMLNRWRQMFSELRLDNL